MSDESGMQEVAFRVANDLEIRCLIGLVSSSPIIGPPRPRRSGEMIIGVHHNGHALDQMLGVAWQVRPASPAATGEREAVFGLVAEGSVAIRVTIGINLSSPIIGPPRPKQYGAMNSVLDDGVELCVFYREETEMQSSVIVGPPPVNR